MAITSPSPAPPPSALQKLFAAHPEPSDSPFIHLHNLALQIAHNLRYQHNWTDVRYHSHTSDGKTCYPRPLITGIPPQRLYIHPDEQIALLQKQKDAGKSGMPELKAEREWVLPSHLREKWSLRRFGEVFDLVGLDVKAEGGKALFTNDEGTVQEEEEVNEWKTTKRVLLATLDDDSTVVYYIVHDGIVKPRQN